jgi:hypothetical protein
MPLAVLFDRRGAPLNWGCTPYLLVSLAVIIFFYWSTLGAMAPQWHSSTYSHGYVIFPASLFIIWKRRNTLGALTSTPSIWAILLLILATFGWLLGDLTTTAG